MGAEGEKLVFVTVILEKDGIAVSENTYLFGTQKEEVFAPVSYTHLDVYKRQLLYLDGKPIQGIDIWHEEALLETELCKEESFQIS